MSETPTWKGSFHVREVPRGVYGQFSKVREELVEGIDALEQGQHLMLLVELADMLGALNGVAEAEGTNVTELYRGKIPGGLRRDEYDEPAMAVLERIELLIDDEQRSAKERISVIAGLLEALAEPFNLDFDDLNHFAVLRSKVARESLRDN